MKATTKHGGRGGVLATAMTYDRKKKT